jgi:hypothetical protein
MKNKRVRTFAFNTETGSSDYATAVAGASTKEPGRYMLVVRVPKGPNGSCEILRRSVMVAEKPPGLNTVWFLVGSLSACALFVGAVVAWARRMSAELRNILVMVLTEASKTVISISFTLGNLVTDLLTTYRVVFEEIAPSPQYRVPYAVFGCLAIMVGLVLIVYEVQRAHMLRLQIKSNALVEQEPAATDTDPEDDASHAVVHKLKWELEKVSRDLKALAVDLLCFFLSDVPMVRAHRPDPQNSDCVDNESPSMRLGLGQAVMTALLVLKENVTDKTVRY